VRPGEPGRADVALAALALATALAWVIAGFVDRDGDARLVLSLALLVLGGVLVARARRSPDRAWVGMLAFVLCGVAGLADRADAGAWGSVLSLLAFGCGVALVLRWRPPRAS
jgi:hypothetical protein